MSLITSDFTRRWPGGCMVWRFHPGLSDDEKDIAQKAMDHWQERANVRFIKRTTQSSFVTFMADDNIDDVSNSSSIGMGGGEQFVRLEPITPDSSRTRTARHEIGHALGLHHEHQRCDRNDFVNVSNNIKLERLFDFDRKCGDDYEDVGDYDFTSIMQYNESPGATTNGEPALTGTNDANQALLEDKDSRKDVSPGDAAGIAKLHGGNAHIYQLSASGQIEKTVRQDSWSDGWTTATPFQMDVRNFMLFLKRSDGTMHLNSINFNGTVGDRVDTRDWTSGWTTAIKYAIGPFNYFLFYKSGNGTLHIHDINANGTIGHRKVDEEIESGWTHIRHYAVGPSNFLFLYNAGTGEARVRSIQWDGKVGGSLQAWTGSPGWTCVEPYTAGGRNYLFRLKASNGLMNIRNIRADGTISSDDTDSRDWTANWTNAIPYYIGGTTYLLLLKSGTGRLDICRLRGDGTVGATTDRREFGPGWTVGSIYYVGIGTFLILVKT